MIRRLSCFLFFGCLVLGFKFSGTAGNYDDLLFENFARDNPFKKQQNIALKKSGSRAVVKTVSGKEKPAEAVIDGSYSEDPCLEVAGTPFNVIISFPKPTKISAVRIFPGIIAYANYPSGECGIKSYQLQGQNFGIWFDLTGPIKNAPTFKESNADSIYSFNYIHLFEPAVLEKFRLVVLESGDTGCRVSSPLKPIIPPAELTSYIREIEIFGSDKKSEAFEVPLERKLQADFELPAYVNVENAVLFLQSTKFLKDNLNLEIAFAEQNTGNRPTKPLNVSIKPGGSPVRLKIPITSWPDGEYLATIRELTGSVNSEYLLRLLYKQTILAPSPPAEPIDVTGLTTYFFDDWYLKEKKGLTVKVNPPELLPVVTGALEEDRVVQRGLGLRLDYDGTFAVSLLNMDRSGQNPRRYTAHSKDAVNWTITQDKPTAELPGKGEIIPAAAEVKVPFTYRFYDPARDGSVLLSEVFVKFHPAGPVTKWGEIDIRSGDAYPVWEKSPGNFLLLTRRPLTQMSPSSDKEDPFSNWRHSNDNGGGQWFSKDGKILFYCQGKVITRYPPFQILYDNLWQYNRILVVWKTTDGINWTPTFSRVPTENDPVGWQHYGAKVYPLEKGNLLMSYLYAYNAKNQQVYLELSYSRDGVFWNRLPGQPAFVPNGPFDSWSFGYCTSNVDWVEKDGLFYQLLNNCDSGPHFSGDYMDDRSKMTPAWLKQKLEPLDIYSWPFWKDVGSWEALAENMIKYSGTVGVMRYRKDGWVSLVPGNRPGVLVTRVLKTNRTLSLNAKTAPEGSLRVELLDESGNPIPGYSGKDAAVFTGDSTEYHLTWKDGLNKELPEKPICLRITIDQAELFALKW